MTGFAFDQHVLQQPDVVAALLDAELPALDPDRPVVFTGIGTSLHACRMAAAWTRIVTDGRVRPAAIDAHDLALSESVQPDDQVVVVSHRGTKRYPNRVLAAAREAGASTIAITGEGAHTPSPTWSCAPAPRSGRARTRCRTRRRSSCWDASWRGRSTPPDWPRRSPRRLGR